MLRSFGQRLAGLGSGALRTQLATCTSRASAVRISQRASSSSSVNEATQPFIVPQPQFEKPMILAEEKKPNVMKVVEREAMARADVDGRAKLFLRRIAPKDRMCAGDVVFVETINSMSDPSATTTFGGVCIAIYRRGIDTSFILRNLVQNVGVEMRFMAYSPLVKHIEVTQKARRVRRAKLFYLRNRPGKAFQGKALRKMSKAQPATAKAGGASGGR